MPKIFLLSKVGISIDILTKTYRTIFKAGLSALTALQLIFFLSGSVLARQSESVYISIGEQSKLIIKGTSNVKDFTCNYDQSLKADTLQFKTEFEEEKISVAGNALNLYTQEFDCGNRGINRDFKSTLKSKTFPQIELKLNELIFSNGNILPDSAQVDILIAGVSKSYMIPLHEINRNKDTIIVKGTTMLSMYDFELKPPSPMFGLIKVNDELEISFQLQLLLHP